MRNKGAVKKIAPTATKKELSFFVAVGAIFFTAPLRNEPCGKLLKADRQPPRKLGLHKCPARPAYQCVDGQTRG